MAPKTNKKLKGAKKGAKKLKAKDQTTIMAMVSADGSNQVKRLGYYLIQGSGKLHKELNVAEVENMPAADLQALVESMSRLAVHITNNFENKTNVVFNYFIQDSAPNDFNIFYSLYTDKQELTSTIKNSSLRPGRH